MRDHGLLESELLSYFDKDKLVASDHRSAYHMRMHVDYFLDLPIYRCAREQHQLETEEAVARAQQWVVENGGGPPEKAPEVYKRVAARARQDFGPWQFNQIVGWLRLFKRDGTEIGAHLWWVSAKRLSHAIKYRTYGLVTASSVLATFYTPDQSSSSILQDLIDKIERLASEPPIKGRFLDMSSLRMLGPVVNWRELLDMQS